MSKRKRAIGVKHPYSADCGVHFFIWLNSDLRTGNLISVLLFFIGKKSFHDTPFHDYLCHFCHSIEGRAFCGWAMRTGHCLSLHHDISIIPLKVFCGDSSLQGPFIMLQSVISKVCSREHEHVQSLYLKCVEELWFY